VTRPRTGAVIVWEFVVRPRDRAAFERIYGPRGSWAALFSLGKGYLGTELYRSGKNRYLTVDRWRSMSDLVLFKRKHRSAYRALDAACERLTTSERLLASGRAVFRKRL
jgi:heme-degrading monooxygenase HmoA